MVTRYWDNISFTYGTRQGRTRFVGHINPFELGVAQNGDLWCFALPSTSKTTLINSSNIADLQAIIDNAEHNERLFFEAGTYRCGTFETAGKPIQIVGETDEQGNNLVTILGSKELDSNDFVLNGSVWEYTSAPALVGAAPADNNPGATSDFFPRQNFQLWFGDWLPYNSVPTANQADNLKNCSFSGGTIRLNEQPSGVLEWGVHKHFIALSNSGSGDTVQSTATHGLIIANFNVVGFTGNRNTSTIGNRGKYYLTGDLVTKYHCIYNVNISDCRGGAIYTEHESTVRNVKVMNCGYGAVQGNFTSAKTRTAGYTDETAKYGLYIGVLMLKSNWAGAEFGDTPKLSSQFFAKFQYCEFNATGRNTKAQVNDGQTTGSGFWTDYGYYTTLENSYIANMPRVGLYIEVSNYCTFRNNVLENNAQDDNFEIFFSNASNCVVSGNTIKPYKRSSTYNICQWGMSDRDNNLYDSPPRCNDNVYEENEVIIAEDATLNACIFFSNAAVAPNDKPWREFTGRNNIIQNNTYPKEPRYILCESKTNFFIPRAYVNTLANIQAITDANNVPFGWETGGVIN